MFVTFYLFIYDSVSNVVLLLIPFRLPQFLSPDQPFSQTVHSIKVLDFDWISISYI